MPNCAAKTLPIRNIPTQPRGDTLNNSRSVIGFVLSNAGVGEIDRRIGAKEIETSTDGITKSRYPDGSGTTSNACAVMMPAICTIM